MTDPKKAEAAALANDDSSPEEDLDAIMQELEAIDSDLDADDSATSASETAPSASAKAPVEAPAAKKAAPERAAQNEADDLSDILAEEEFVSEAPADDDSTGLDDLNMDSEVEEMASEPVTEPLRAIPGPALSAVPRASNVEATGNGQSLTMKLVGSMQLQLEFESGGRTLALECTDVALICRFGDGTEVRIPTDAPQKTSFKRSA